MSNPKPPITVNWKAVNKMITEGNTKEIREIARAIKEKVDAKCNEHWKQKKEQEQRNKITALKALPVGAPVFYTGNFAQLLGKSGTVKKQGRTRMVVDFDIGAYQCYYDSLSTTPLTEQELDRKRVNAKLTALINNL